MKRIFTVGILAGAMIVICLAAARVWTSRAKHMPWFRSNVQGAPTAPARYEVRRILPLVDLQHPLDMALLPGGDRLLIACQDGRFFSARLNQEGAKAAVAFEMGRRKRPFHQTLGFTPHPGFETNRFLYVCYCEAEKADNGTVVSRFTMSQSEPPTIDPDSEREVIRWPSGGHNGTCLKFGPDGDLYISTGDASPANPPDVGRTGQDISDLTGSILRIDVDHAGPALPYSIPKDNPFVNVAGARGEVYAFGLRNPWRMNFNLKTGELFAGDVGWELWEMVHRIKPGGNHGWSLMEAGQPAVPDQKQGPGPILPPLLALPHSECASITGGVFYRGTRFPELAGCYLFGDWESGRLWALRNEEDKVVWQSKITDSTIRIVSFSETKEGEPLLLDYAGGVYELVRNDEPDLSARFPRTLAATGLFRETSKQTPNPGVYAYTINAPMWADHATAERWVGIPSWRPMTNSEYPKFPKGTVFAKTLELEMTAGKPESRKRVETQLLHWDGRHWAAYSYRWNEAQTDAELVPPTGTNVTLKVADKSAPGGTREQAWRFAGTAECLRCHNLAAGFLLGFNLAQLNTDPDGGSGGELERIKRAGLLVVKRAPNPLPRLAGARDERRPVSERAKAWLDVNCSNCHGETGGGLSILNFRQSSTNGFTRGVDETALRGDFGINGAALMAAGDPSRSVLYYRINTEGLGHMPHIGPRLVDVNGAGLIHDWIESGLSSSNSPSLRAGTGARETERAIVAAGLEKASDGELGALLAGTSGALDAVTLWNKGVLSDALKARVLATAAKSTNGFTQDLMQRFRPAEARRKKLGPAFDPQAVLTLNGDAARGRALFESPSGPQCARCHVFKGAGRAFGPNLAAASAKFDRAGLLDQIMHPSRLIDPPYALHRIETTDGAESSGMIARQDNTSLTLRLETLEEVTFPLSKIATNQTSRVSAMPEGLLENLSPQEAADLLQYLAEH